MFGGKDSIEDVGVISNLQVYRGSWYDCDDSERNFSYVNAPNVDSEESFG